MSGSLDELFILSDPYPCIAPCHPLASRQTPKLPSTSSHRAVQRWAAMTGASIRTCTRSQTTTSTCITTTAVLTLTTRLWEVYPKRPPSTRKATIRGLPRLRRMAYSHTTLLMPILATMNTTWALTQVCSRPSHRTSQTQMPMAYQGISHLRQW